MAKLYANSVAGSNTSPYDTWAKGATAIQTLLTAYTAGDEIWVAHDHAESGAGADVTLTASAAATLRQRVPLYRVNRSTDVYSPSTGSDAIQIDTSDGAYDLSLDFEGVWHGFHLKMGDDLVADLSPSSNVLVDCYLNISSSQGRLAIGAFNSDAPFTMLGGTINFSHANGGEITPRGGPHIFKGTTFTGTIYSTGLVTPANARTYCNDFIACDFSGLNAGIFLNSSSSSSTSGRVRVINCDHPSGWSWTDSYWSNTAGNFNTTLEVYNTDSGGNLYAVRYESPLGLTTEDTATYHDSGYVDDDGSTNLSMKMEARGSLTEPHSPMEGLPILARIDSTGSKTFTVECVENLTTAVTKRKAWIKVYHLGSATETLWSIANDREIVAASYTNLAAGTGLGNWTSPPTGSRSVKLTATATVNQAGLYMVVVCFGDYESGKVFHYDPLVTVT